LKLLVVIGDHRNFGGDVAARAQSSPRKGTSSQLPEQPQATRLWVSRCTQTTTTRRMPQGPAAAVVDNLADCYKSAEQYRHLGRKVFAVPSDSSVKTSTSFPLTNQAPSKCNTSYSYSYGLLWQDQPDSIIALDQHGGKHDCRLLYKGREMVIHG